MEEASKVFESVLSKDVITWGAMISGFASCGHYTEAREYVERMQSEQGLRPTEIIFLSVLAACGHGGALDRGHECFASMTAEEHGFGPEIEHYSGMADLLSRAGHLAKAKDMLHSMPFAPDLFGFTSLLTSCKTYGHSGITSHCHARFFDFDSRPDPA
jgi:pentatricopeptide repeat protein